jgi:hypothetical protein
MAAVVICKLAARRAVCLRRDGHLALLVSGLDNMLPRHQEQPEYRHGSAALRLTPEDHLDGQCFPDGFGAAHTGTIMP